jgi:hypothetical protein
MIKGDPPAYRHPPYQGGQGGSRTKSIFNLIETTYLNILDYTKVFRRGRAGLVPDPALLGLVGKMYSKIHSFWRARGRNHKDTKDTKIDRSSVS